MTECRRLDYTSEPSVTNVETDCWMGSAKPTWRKASDATCGNGDRHTCLLLQLI